MKRLLGTVFGIALVSGLTFPVAARADDKDPQAILDKAIKAVGGEEKLKKVEAFLLKTKGTINFGGNESEYKGTLTARGLDHMRRESEMEFNGEPRTFLMIVAGDKGWMKFGDEPREMEDEALANWKRRDYLEVLPVTLVAIKGKGFKLEAAGEEKVDGKPAAGVKVTAPDGKDFTMYFDKESGLPVKQVAKVAGFQGDENTQETTFKDYKDFGGIKKATRVETTRDGEPFIKTEVTEFKVLEKVDPKTFEEPTS
ncbi:MAG: hypothetical protein ACYC61_12590 [Isosphaeraceae bacterium]